MFIGGCPNCIGLQHGGRSAFAFSEGLLCVKPTFVLLDLIQVPGNMEEQENGAKRGCAKRAMKLRMVRLINRVRLDRYVVVMTKSLGICPTNTIDEGDPVFRAFGRLAQRRCASRPGWISIAPRFAKILLSLSSCSAWRVRPRPLWNLHVCMLSQALKRKDEKLERLRFAGVSHLEAMARTGAREADEDKTMNAIELLKQDHVTVKVLLEQLKNTTERV